MTDSADSLLREAMEELRLIRMKDSPAVYDPTLRARISIFLSRSEASKEQPNAAHAQLMRFYNVDTLDALVAAQAYHIEKLQAKLPPPRDTQPRKVREG